MKNLLFLVLLATGLSAFAEDKLIPNAGDSHDADIYALLFSPDGKEIVSSSGDGTIVVWDAASGKRLKSSPRRTTTIFALALSPDGGLIASTDSTSKAVQVRDSASMEVKWSFTEHRFDPSCLAFSRDGKYLASGGSDDYVILYGLEGKGKILMKLKLRDSDQRGLKFSKDGGSFFTISRSGLFSVIDVEKKKVVRSEQLVREAGVNVMNVSSDEKFIAFGCANKRVYIYDLETLKQRQSLWHGAPVRSSAISPDGRYVLSGGYDGQVIRWDAATGKSTGSHKNFMGPVMGIAFTADGSKFACSAGKTITMFETEKGNSLRLWMKKR